ncbi:MAG: hypothetical protein HW388_725 [Dehalococcoidia bacterium]|nr:hypothetical protein [Dehalococcoidia bacterium]
MALRLAGEEFSVVRGLDALGWPREITVNDAVPGLKVTQSGAGVGVQMVTGSLDLGANKLRSTNLLLKEESSNQWTIKSAADDAYRSLQLATVYLRTSLAAVGDGIPILADDVDNYSLLFKARDNGVGLVEVARLQGQAEPRFKFTLPAQLYTKTDTGNPAGVEGDLYVNLFDNGLYLFADGAWRTVVSW